MHTAAMRMSPTKTRTAWTEAGDLGALFTAVLALNVADAVFTLGYVGGGLAQEANPLMAVALEAHPVLFVCTKLGLVLLGLALLWRRRSRSLAAYGLVAVFVVYYALFLFHLEGQQIAAEIARSTW